MKIVGIVAEYNPFHNGHAALLAKALETAPRVIVVLGSAFAARNALVIESLL